MENFTSLYFIGAGGIGMSALVRYFLAKGYHVAGYDRTPSDLTEALINEGAEIVYDENSALIPEYCRHPKTTLVVYTPAVPESHNGFSYFRENGFTIVKRAKLLGMITRTSKALCFAGTHGKTTTSSMAAHILAQSPLECNAFLGGILKNYNSNLILSNTSEFTVIEADEYDRSFHQLSPYMAVITATDPDHLDIYGTEEAYLESFRYFTSLIQPGGALVIKKGIKVQQGVYIGTQGPTFETPSEYKMFHILGADAVGMSTVPEVIVANHCGIKVFGVSVITDLGVEGKIVEVSHEEVQKAADEAQPRMTTIMRELINRA